jgi:hypothetical protein
MIDPNGIELGAGVSFVLHTPLRDEGIVGTRKDVADSATPTTAEVQMSGLYAKGRH